MMPRLLDLFCGAGGAAMGYHRAGFEVVGVDINPQSHYPFEFHQGDALTFPLDGFDAIHASPPLDYSTALVGIATSGRYQRLLEPIRTRLEASGLPWVIENVPGAPVASGIALWGQSGVMLCGSTFDLGVETPNGWREVRRHRYFESPIPLWTEGCRHRYPSINPYSKEARKRDGIEKGADLWFGRAMGVEWEKRDYQIREAIPPAYTEWIGRQLLAAIERAA